MHEISALEHLRPHPRSRDGRWSCTGLVGGFHKPAPDAMHRATRRPVLQARNRAVTLRSETWTRGLDDGEQGEIHCKNLTHRRQEKREDRNGLRRISDAKAHHQIARLAQTTRLSTKSTASAPGMGKLRGSA